MNWLYVVITLILFSLLVRAAAAGLHGRSSSRHLVSDGPRPKEMIMCEDRSQEILEMAIRNLQSHQIRFAQVPGAPMLMMPFCLKEATYHCHLGVENELLRFYSMLGCHVPEEKRLAVAELLCRINSRLGVGNFEMDFADGEIRFRATFNARGIELAEAMVETTIQANLYTIERFSPAIMGVLWNDVCPEDAMAMLDGTPSA